MSNTSSMEVNDVVTKIVFFTKELVKNKNIYNELENKYDKYAYEIESNNKYEEETNRYYENQKFAKGVPCWPTFLPASIFLIHNQNSFYRDKLQEIEHGLELAKHGYETAFTTIGSIFNNLSINRIIEIASYLDINVDEIKINSSVKFFTLTHV